MDINNANVDLARGAIARNRDMVVGIKARLSGNVAGTNDLEALRRAQEAAAPCGLPVMIHMGQSCRRCAPFWRCSSAAMSSPMYAPAPNGILDDKGQLLPEVLAARRRGVWFDFGNGVADHFNWDVVERSMRQGFGLTASRPTGTRRRAPPGWSTSPMSCRNS